MENKYPKIERLSFKNLGTEIDLQILVESKKQSLLAKKNLDEIRALYGNIEKIFSRFESQSELSQLNNHIGEFQTVSEEMLEISKKALLYYETTGGFFDPRIIEDLEKIGYDKSFDSMDPSGNILENKNVSFGGKLSRELLVVKNKVCFEKRMDFSGIVKGYATDKMSHFLSAQKWKNFLVDSGGDMFFAGFGEDGRKWRVDIEGIPEKYLMLELSGDGVATSGIGRRKWERNGKRFHHLINPRKPKDFSFDLQSVTVIENTTEKADIWAKTLFLAGSKEAERMAEENGIACVILNYNGKAWISSAVKKYIFIQ